MNVSGFFGYWGVSPVPDGWVSANVYVAFITMIIDVSNGGVVGYYTWGFSMHLENKGGNRASVDAQPTDKSTPHFTSGPYGEGGKR